MSNLFKDALSGDGGKDSMMGPDYSYYKFIKEPSAIGMSDKGSLKQMGKNIDGLISYVDLLVTGKSKASTTGQPLGNKFFLKTGGKCMDKSSVSEEGAEGAEGEEVVEGEGVEVDRYIYVNNVPIKNILC